MTTRISSAAVMALLLSAGTIVAYTASGSPSAERSRASPLGIKGSVRVLLRPGASRALNLRLSNRRRFALSVTRLRVRVSVDRRHRAAGCSARRDFAVRQIRRRAFPIRLAPRSRRSLKQLRVRRLPRVRMRNHLRRNQDACKGASLRLTYTGRVRKAFRRRPGLRG